MKYYGFCKDILHINLEHYHYLKKLWFLIKYKYSLKYDSVNYYGFVNFFDAVAWVKLTTRDQILTTGWSSMVTSGLKTSC